MNAEELLLPFAGKESDDDLDRALVGPNDGRIHEIATTHYPYNTVCHLGRDFGDGRWRGCSGVLIGPRKVLTAGHCLFSIKLGRAPRRVRVAPGRMDRDSFPYGTIIAREFYVPERFVRPRSRTDRKQFDYGLIVLPKPFPGIRRFLPVKALNKDDLLSRGPRRKITVAGYPGDRPVGTLWRHSEQVARVTPRRLMYSVDTCPGHSGSPIWLSRGDGGEIIVGVHTSGIIDRNGHSFGCSKGVILAPPGMLNSGVRITPEVLANLRHPRRRVEGSRPMFEFGTGLGYSSFPDTSHRIRPTRSWANTPFVL